MRILGIDPGLRLTGYGVIDVTPLGTVRLVDAGVIRLDGDSDVASRLVELEREMQEIVDEFRPTVCAVEKLYAHYAHPTTAITMGHGRGVVLLVAARANVRIVELAANRIKQSITGHGHAHKDQMQRAVQAIFRLPELPTPPDVADALAIAVCCARQIENEPAALESTPANDAAPAATASKPALRATPVESASRVSPAPPALVPLADSDADVASPGSSKPHSTARARKPVAKGPGVGETARCRR